MEFKNLKDLYKRICPALSSKISELKRMGYFYIKEEDIWNYLSEIKWNHTTHLTLANMVDDIFNLNDEHLNNYVLEILKREEREVKDSSSGSLL